MGADQRTAPGKQAAQQAAGIGRGDPRMNANAHRKMTPKGQMSSSGMGPAVTHLPPHLKALFEPNAPLEHVPQLTKRKMPPYGGLVDFVNQFETQAPPERKVEETPKERRERLALEKTQQSEAKIQEEVAKWDPQAADERKTDDAYKTLFVGRISFETTEKQLRHEFEQYGPIKKIRLVEDEDGKSRGYAFVEYEKESDLKTAYKQADGKKIDGRRVVVDVERGRTVRDWRPRKYGGGIGDTRKGGPDVNVKYSGREPISQVKVGGYGGADDRYRPRERSRSRSRGRAAGGGSSRDGRRESRRRSPSRSRSRSRGRDGRDRSRDRGGRDRDRHRERRDSRDYHRSDRGGSRRDR